MNKGSAFKLALDRYKRYREENKTENWLGTTYSDTDHFTSFYADRDHAEKSVCRNPPNEFGITTPCDGKSYKDYHSYLGEAFINDNNRMMVHSFRTSEKLEEHLSSQAARSALPAYENMGEAIFLETKRLYLFTDKSTGLCAIAHQEYLRARAEPYKRLHIYFIEEDLKELAEMGMAINDDEKFFQQGALASIQAALKPADLISGTTKVSELSFRKKDGFSKDHPNPVCQ